MAREAAGSANSMSRQTEWGGYPRTLREILPCLMKLILHNIASSDEDKTQVAAACLGIRGVLQRLGTGSPAA